MATDYTIREARLSDVQTLIAFTLEEAREAEAAALDVVAVTRGIQAAFESAPPVRYWVAEDSHGRIVASTSIFTEWSDFRGGYYWWIQSLFISPSHRGRGLVERLLDYLANEASSSAALELRLYAHESNQRALRVYRRCGFASAPYVIMSRPLRH